jgi:membrane dipeptidase
MRSDRLWRLTVIGLIGCCTISAGAQAPNDADARARAIHRRILVIDSHTDVLLPGSPENLYAPGHTSHTDLDKLKRGGVGCVAMAIAVGNGPRTPEAVAAAHAEADAKLAAIRGFVKDNSNEAALALTADDILRIHKAGKIAVIESFLNTRSIGADISAIDGLYRDGVRLFGFSHAGNNDFADSSRPSGEPAEEHHGLSPIGKQAVAKLNAWASSHLSVDPGQRLPVLRCRRRRSRRPLGRGGSSNTPRWRPQLDAIKANGVVDVTPFSNYTPCSPGWTLRRGHAPVRP